jgi:hypothetical protein
MIKVPREIALVKIETEGGNIDASGVAGRVEAESGGGSMRLDDIGGGAHVDTGGGSINVGTVNGDIGLHTGGGSIEVHQANGKIVAETGGGSVRLFPRRREPASRPVAAGSRSVNARDNEGTNRRRQHRSGRSWRPS